jgi:hypothetical protein
MRFAQGKLSEGSGSMGTEILRCAQDDRIDRMTVPTYDSTDFGRYTA